MRNQTNSLPQTARKTSAFLKRGLSLATTLIITLSFTLPNHVTAGTIPPETIGHPTSMTPLSLKGVQRVLVISPHPDDETIAPGGLIQMALANGSQVRVVIVTNGDGQLFAPAIFAMDDALTPAGYVSIGERRQAESLAALKQLGLPPENILFLGYPDRGIGPMLKGNWDEAHPYTAPFTRTTNSPYSKTYHPRATYCGESLLSDLEIILSGFRPDLIVLPHPSDQHSDHQATSHFTSLAVASLQAQDPAYQPRLWAYLVHYGDNPESSASGQSQGFLPPADLAVGTSSWGYLALTSGQERNKSTAIQDYPTQSLLLGKFLPDFVRANEIFMVISTPVSNHSMPLTTGTEIPLLESAGLLPAKTSAITDWHTDPPYNLTHFAGRGGSDQEQEWGQLGEDPILRRGLVSQIISKRFHKQS